MARRASCAAFGGCAPAAAAAPPAPIAPAVRATVAATDVQSGRVGGVVVIGALRSGARRGRTHPGTAGDDALRYLQLTLPGSHLCGRVAALVFERYIAAGGQ